MTILRPGRVRAATAISILVLLGIAGAAQAADQVLVGVNSVRFAWAPAAGAPTGYLVSRSLNGSAYLVYATTLHPEIAIPVKAGDQVSIRVAAAGYDSSGAYVTGPLSPVSDRIIVQAAPTFPVAGSWLLRCATATCNTLMSRSLGNASLVLAQAPGLAAPWRVLGVAKLQYGRDQIIWQNTTTGKFAVYDGQFLAPITALTATASTALRAVGATDFDRDGLEEFIVQRTDTGAVNAWAVDSGSFQNVATIPGPVGAQLVAVQDFDVDGRPDLLWRDPVARTLDLWILAKDPTLGFPVNTLISRTVRVASGVTGDATIAATGDFDGNGSPDVLWRYFDGRLAISFLTAGLPQRYVELVPAAGDGDLRVIGPIDIGGTLGEEIALQDNNTGLIWILDPSTSGANTRGMVLHAGSEWKVFGIGS